LSTNIKKDQISPDQQKTGRARFLWFIRINTISYGCLADAILILYAIRLGADDFIVGLMASFIYLTMPLMFIGKQMISKFGAAHAYGLNWIVRNFFAAFLILVPFVIKSTNQSFGLAFLIFFTFGFFAFRSIGFTGNTPLIGEITNNTNRGNYLSKLWLQFTFFYFITLLILIYILKYFQSVFTFQLIIMTGVVFGIIGSVIVYFVPESINPKISSRISIFQSFSSLWKNTRCRKLLFSWTAVTIANALVMPFSLVALKNGYNISDHNALLFSLIQLFGGIIASLLNILILDKVGPRPMLILYSLMFLISCSLWIVSPAEFVIYIPVVIFIINGMALAGTNTALSHYFLTVVQEQKRVGANILFLIISGGTAGIAGTILGGGLLKYLNQFEISSLSVYRTFFLIILLVLIPLFFVIKKIERLEDWNVKDVLKIFISFRDIRALFTLNRLEKSKM